ncbi:MAG TPA: hypothetical protein VEA41_18355 [Salinarimonas sp.]|nr:hypothetical protein [Salinarimonas sp.]
MSFRDNLLKARGQIAFISALAVSTAVIIHLENLDTEGRIQARLTGAAPAAVPETVRSRAEDALRRAREAHAAAPGADETRAALLVAASAAVQAGALPQADGLALAHAAAGDGRAATPALAAAMAQAAMTFPALRERLAP